MKPANGRPYVVVQMSHANNDRLRGIIKQYQTKTPFRVTRDAVLGLALDALEKRTTTKRGSV